MQIKLTLTSVGTEEYAGPRLTFTNPNSESGCGYLTLNVNVETAQAFGRHIYKEFTINIEEPSEGEVGRTKDEIWKEIRENVRYISEQAPDVEDGDMTQEEVEEFWLDLFQEYAAAFRKEADGA